MDGKDHQHRKSVFSNHQTFLISMASFFKLFSSTANRNCDSALVCNPTKIRACRLLCCALRSTLGPQAAAVSMRSDRRLCACSSLARSWDEDISTMDLFVSISLDIPSISSFLSSSVEHSTARESPSCLSSSHSAVTILVARAAIWSALSTRDSNASRASWRRRAYITANCSAVQCVIYSGSRIGSERAVNNVRKYEVEW